MKSLGWSYVLAHTGMWIDIWVILTIIILIAVVIYFILRRRKMVKMEEELEDLLADKYEKAAEELDGISDEEGVE